MGRAARRVFFGIVMANVIAMAASSALPACGLTSQDDKPGTSAAGGAPGAGGSSVASGGSIASSGGAEITGGRSCGAGFAEGKDGQTDLVEPSDNSDCLARPSVACNSAAIQEALQQLDAAPFADCKRFMPFDGCGRQLFDFDENGCLLSMTTPVNGSGHLSDHFESLRACLKPLLEASRWTCLPSVRLEFCESCFIR